MKKQSVSDILNSELNKMQKQNAAYSLRALARDIGISPSFLSAVISGKRPFPKKRLDDFAKALRIDEPTRERLAKAIDLESIKKISVAISDQKTSDDTGIEKFKNLPDKSVSLLEHWYYVGAMDLAICENGKLDAKIIAKRLGITESQAKFTLMFLVENKWLKLENGRYVKGEDHIRVPTRNSRAQVREFHKQMIQLALSNLITKTDEETFASRLITGVTFSANPNNLEKARIRLNEAIYEVANILMEGECTEVYQLNTQLFKLTK